MTLEEIKTFEAEGGDFEIVIDHLSAYIDSHPECDEALTLRGIRYWSCGRRADSIKDHLAAIRLNPESRSKTAMRSAYEVLNFFNKDLYNP